jgi:hypothetical protein
MVAAGSTKSPERSNEMPSTTPSARATQLQLLRRGLSPVEAANVTALLVGLRPIEGGWTIRQIERLRFLRYLVEAGRLTL